MGSEEGVGSDGESAGVIGVAVVPMTEVVVVGRDGCEGG